jgi:hypothetical protein
MAMRYYAPNPGGGGYPPRSTGSHVLRVGDAERDAAAADLSEHYVAGRLSLNELHERLGAVFDAKTRGQLGRPFADLPALRQAARPAPAGGFPPPRGSKQDTATDRAGRFAALSLLILAMLIWLTTALLFARHGFYHQPPMHPARFPMQPPFGG